MLTSKSLCWAGVLLCGGIPKVAFADFFYRAKADVVRGPDCQDIHSLSATPVTASTACDAFSAEFQATAHGDAIANANKNHLSGKVHGLADKGLNAQAEVDALFEDTFTWTDDTVVKFDFTGTLDATDEGNNFIAQAFFALGKRDKDGNVSDRCFVISEFRGPVTCTLPVNVSSGETLRIGEQLLLSVQKGFTDSGYFGTVNALDTAFISSITALDASGKIIPDPGLISSSGFDYTINQGGGGPSPVPEPTSLALLGTGLLGLAGMLRRSVFRGLSKARR